MAKQIGWIQRSLQKLSAQLKALSSGEGESPAARLGRSVQKGTERLKTMLRLSPGGDAFEAVPEGPRSRKSAQRLIGSPEVAFVPQNGMRARNLNATVPSEFRGQIAAGLAAASSRAVGSSLVDAPSWDD